MVYTPSVYCFPPGAFQRNTSEADLLGEQQHQEETDLQSVTSFGYADCVTSVECIKKEIELLSKKLDQLLSVISSVENVSAKSEVSKVKNTAVHFDAVEAKNKNSYAGSFPKASVYHAHSLKSHVYASPSFHPSKLY